MDRNGEPVENRWVMSAPNLPDSVIRQISHAIAEGEKIEAIKIYKEATGASLKDSKEYVEALMRGENPVNQPAAATQTRDTDLSPEVYRQISAAVAAKRKIDAIKIYRDATGAGLKESKDYIDDFVPSVVITSQAESQPQENRNPSTHPATKSSGCSVKMLILAGLLIGGAFLLW